MPSPANSATTAETPPPTWQPPPPSITQQALRNAAIVALAAQALAAVWPRIDWTNPAGARTAVSLYYRAIVTRYGQAAAAVAAEYYDAQRATHRLPSRYRAAPAQPVPTAQITRIVESAFLGRRVDAADVVDLDTPRPSTTSDLPLDERVPQRLEQSLSRLVQQPARDTIAENTDRDPAKPRWIRVPTGATTCEFCIMLASRELGSKFRGYSSSSAAGIDGSSTENTFHKGCDCVAVPIFPGDDITQLSPNISDYQDLYERGVAAAGTRRDTTKILVEMRKIQKADAAAEAKADNDAPSRGPRNRTDPTRPGGKRRPDTSTGSTPPPPPGPPSPPTGGPMFPGEDGSDPFEHIGYKVPGVPSLNRLTDREQGLLESYALNGFERINGALRGHRALTPDIEHAVEELRTALRKYPLPNDIRVTREVGGSVFGIIGGKNDRDRVARLIGQQFLEDGFMSTTMGANPAHSTRRQHPLVLDLLVPQGTPAVELGKLAGYPLEREMLIIDARRYVIVGARYDEPKNQWRIFGLISQEGSAR